MNNSGKLLTLMVCCDKIYNMTEIPKPDPENTIREHLEDPLPLRVIIPGVADALDTASEPSSTSIEPSEVNYLLRRQVILLRKPLLTHEEDVELQHIHDQLTLVANGLTQPNIDEN